MHCEMFTTIRLINSSFTSHNYHFCRSGENFFLAALGLRCCARAFSSCGEQELLFLVVHGLLIAVASLVAEHRL